ncbi:glycerate kinase, partial [Salmonella enterica]|nr:glycerate kinase [Salmonella enterica]
MKYIKNQDELITARPEEKLRRDIIDIAENVLDYVNPGLITRKIVQLNDNQLIIQNKSYQLTPETRIF